jgi:hypothetical protein
MLHCCTSDLKRRMIKSQVPSRVTVHATAGNLSKISRSSRDRSRTCLYSSISCERASEVVPSSPMRRLWARRWALMVFFTVRIRSGVRLLWPKGSSRPCRVPLSLKESSRRSSTARLSLEYSALRRVVFDRPVAVRGFFFNSGFKRSFPADLVSAMAQTQFYVKLDFKLHADRLLGASALPIAWRKSSPRACADPIQIRGAGA